MKNLSNAVTFMEVARQDSFVKAAHATGLSSSAVSKAVAKLEEELGVKLLQRTTRNVTLTAEGQRFFDAFGRLNQELVSLTEEMQGQQKAPAGPLHVSVPPVFGRHVLMRFLPEFMGKYPQINLEISFEAGAVNLASDKVDVALRAGQLPDSANLVARKLTDVQRLTCCHADFQTSIEALSHPRDLNQFPIITARAKSTGKLAPLSFTVAGSGYTLTPDNSLVLNDADAMYKACESGLGVAQVFDFQLQPERSELCPVMQAFNPPALPLYAMYLDRHLVSSRIRAFIDYLVSRLSGRTAM